jgi:hypothetical protein
MGFLGNNYTFEPGEGALRDPVLAKFNIETFLISCKKQVSYFDYSTEDLTSCVII